MKWMIMTKEDTVTQLGLQFYNTDNALDVNVLAMVLKVHVLYSS